jgi:hypothetical protein
VLVAGLDDLDGESGFFRGFGFFVEEASFGLFGPEFGVVGLVPKVVEVFCQVFFFHADRGEKCDERGQNFLQIASFGTDCRIHSLICWLRANDHPAFPLSCRKEKS